MVAEIIVVHGLDVNECFGDGYGGEERVSELV